MKKCLITTNLLFDTANILCLKLFTKSFYNFSNNFLIERIVRIPPTIAIKHINKNPSVLPTVLAILIKRN